MSGLAGVNNFKLFTVASLAFNTKRDDWRKLIMNNGGGRQQNLNEWEEQKYGHRQRRNIFGGNTDKGIRATLIGKDPKQTSLENF